MYSPLFCDKIEIMVVSIDFPPVLQMIYEKNQLCFSCCFLIKELKTFKGVEVFSFSVLSVLECKAFFFLTFH